MPTYRHKSYCIFVCDYHLVSPTEYRRKVINEGVKAFLLPKIDPIAVGGWEDRRDNKV